MATSTFKTPKPTSSQIFTKYVGTIKAKPGGQQRISLGNYSADQPAKGFSIEISPDTGDDEHVKTAITTAGGPRRHEYTLHITNNSNRMVYAEVWRI